MLVELVYAIIYTMRNTMRHAMKHNLLIVNDFLATAEGPRNLLILKRKISLMISRGYKRTLICCSEKVKSEAKISSEAIRVVRTIVTYTVRTIVRTIVTPSLSYTVSHEAM